MIKTRAGWIAAGVFSLLWLAPAPLWLYLGAKADVQEQFVPGNPIDSFPFRHAQNRVGLAMLALLALTVLVWAVAAAWQAWRRWRADSADAS